MKRYVNSVKNLSNWSDFWKYYYAAKEADSEGVFLAKLRSGLRAQIPKVLISAFDEVFLREVYSGGLKNFSKSPMVIDIGANVGYFTLYLLSRVPNAKVIAFEPLPSNLGLLETHKKDSELDGLTIDKRAVYATEKSIEISYNEDLDFSVGASVLSRKKANTSIQIEAVSIPDIFDIYKLEKCDLLKVDCEGAEYNILFNCPDEFYSKIENIVIELHDWVPESEGTPQKLETFLSSKGYRVDLKSNGMMWANKN